MQNNTNSTAALKKLITWARALKISETIIPSDIEALANLEILNLYNQNLTTLPNEISALTNLKKLYLASNCFNELPLVVCRLKKLETLFIMNNTIDNLPNEIMELSNLKELVAFDNNISDITNIVKMKQLDYLILSYNKLSPEQTKALEKAFSEKVNCSNQKIDKK